MCLQLLTKVCQAPGGHAAVSEAVSTLRLKYGEGGRFRFLAGALLAPRAAIALRVAGVSFLNAFLKSAPRTQTRLYIQVKKKKNKTINLDAQYMYFNPFIFVYTHIYI